MKSESQACVYQLFSTDDCIVTVDAEWRQREYLQVACPVCFDVLEEHRNTPLNIHLGWDSDLPSISGGIWDVRAQILDRAFADDLRLAERGFTVGNVSMGDKEVAALVSVIGGTSVRLRTHNDEPVKESRCRGCGRLCLAINHRVPRWIRAADVAGRDICASLLGTTLIVSEKLWLSLDPDIRAQLNRTERLEVRA